MTFLIFAAIYLLMMMLVFGILYKWWGLKHDDYLMVPAVLATIMWPVAAPLICLFLVGVWLFKLPIAIINWFEERPCRTKPAKSSNNTDC